MAILAPLAEAIARLFAEGDRRLVRECGSYACSLWFCDRTKAHRRRWCSMGACGARAKGRGLPRAAAGDVTSMIC